MEYRGFNISIEQDLDPINPRESDNLGIMVCFHRRYNLGDKHEFKTGQDFMDWVSGEQVVMLPIYIYDHSGITINTTGFSCPWDSGQIGYIYVTLADLEEEGLPMDRAERILKAEVEEYDDYLTGNVWGYSISPVRANIGIQCDDACWGFYGTDGQIEAEAQAKSAIDYAIKNFREQAKQGHATAIQMKSFMRTSWAH